MNTSEIDRRLKKTIAANYKGMRLGVIEVITGTVLAIPDASTIVQDLSNRHPDIANVIGDLVNMGIGPAVALAVGVWFVEDGIKNVLANHAAIIANATMLMDLRIRETQDQHNVK